MKVPAPRGGFRLKNIEDSLRKVNDIAINVDGNEYYIANYMHKKGKVFPEYTDGDIIFVTNPDGDEIEVKTLGYNLNFDDPKNVQMENGFCKVSEAATGMMLVKREVFRTMMKKFPERKYQSDQIINGQSFSSDNCYDLFSVGPYETNGKKRYLSEDYYFSRLWQECGGEIWADVAMPLTHFGNRAFKGHVGSLFAKKNETINEL